MKKLFIYTAIFAIFCIFPLLYDVLTPEYYQVIGKADEHEMYLRDKYFNRDTVLVENAYLYPKGFRFTGWTIRDIATTGMYDVGTAMDF